MTALEFLTRLQQLPSSTPMYLPHVAAALEMLTPILTCRPKNSVERQKRWSDEAALTEWLGEPVSTIKDWRLDATGNRQYRLGAVIDWLDEHMIALTGSEADTDEDAARIVEACWTSLIPALEVDSYLVGFFRSLNLEREPAGYQILHIDPVNDGDGIRAFESVLLSKKAVFKLADTLHALGEFAVQVVGEPDAARQIYLKWKDAAMPAILLQFFRSALLHDPKLASEIAGSLDSALVRKSFHLASWLWNLLLDSGLSVFDGRQLGEITKLLDEHGVNVNQASCVRNANQRIMFQGTAAHLLADTTGTTFHLAALENDGGVVYNMLLTSLLERALNVDLPNLNQQTGRTIAETVAGASPFLRVLGSYESAMKLKVELADKNGKHARCK